MERVVSERFKRPELGCGVRTLIDAGTIFELGPSPLPRLRACVRASVRGCVGVHGCELFVCVRVCV